MFSFLLIWFVSNYDCLWCLLAYLFHCQKGIVLPLMLCSLPNVLLCMYPLSSWPANIPVVAEWWEVPRLSPCLAHQKWGWDQDQRWELWVAPPWSPLLSSDHGLESDRSSASTSSSVASVSERLGVSSAHTMADGPIGKPEATWR